MVKKLPINTQGGKIYRVPDRTVSHRPARSTRRYLYTDKGTGKVTPHPEMIDELENELPAMLRETLTLFLYEHCVFGEPEHLWITLQKGELSAALSSAVEKIMSHKERIHDLFAASGGTKLVTAHLLSAEYWDEAAKVILDSLNLSKYLPKITTKIRPLGGMPMYDEAMITLAEIVERGDWEY